MGHLLCAGAFDLTFDYLEAGAVDLALVAVDEEGDGEGGEHGQDDPEPVVEAPEEELLEEPFLGESGFGHWRLVAAYCGVRLR